MMNAGTQEIWLRRERYVSPPLAGGVGGGGERVGDLFQNLKRGSRSFAPLPNPPREGEGIPPLALRDCPLNTANFAFGGAA